jgi:cell division protein FtsQ
MRRALLAALILSAVLVAGYTFWLRNSSLVQVQNVTIQGVTGHDAGTVRAALAAAAREQTTLSADPAAIARAVAGYPIVASVQVKPDFPHGMTIRVNQRVPAALVVSGGRAVPTASDGTFLADAEGRKLPRVEIRSAPTGPRLGPGDARAAVAIAGAIPAPLASRVKTIEHAAGKGVVIPLENGPELIFGDGTRARAKWAAAARVLANPDADGAAYLDIRIPERPAAGGLPVQTVDPVAPATATDPAAPANVQPADSGATPPATQQPSATAAPQQAAPQGQSAPPAAAGGGVAPNTQP